MATQLTVPCVTGEEQPSASRWKAPTDFRLPPSNRWEAPKVESKPPIIAGVPGTPVGVTALRLG